MKKETMYMSVFNDLKSKIEMNYLRPGDKLPSIREMQKHYSCSKNTVLSALRELEANLLIECRERSGNFVLSPESLYPKNEKVFQSVRAYTDRAAFEIDLSPNACHELSLPAKHLGKIFREVFEDSGVNLVGGSDPKGMLSLREALTRYLSISKGIDTDPPQIIIGAGMEYLYQILFRLLNKSSVFGVESPGYDIVPSMLKLNGMAYMDIPVDDSGVCSDILKRTNVSVLVCTPIQFPLGISMSSIRRKEVLSWASQSDERFIIEDDYDSDLQGSSKKYSPLKSLDKSDSVIYIASFSKTMSPGFRVSYMVLPKKLAKKYDERLPFMSCPVSNPVQECLRRFIDSGAYKRHVNSLRRSYSHRRDGFVAALKNHQFVDEVLVTESSSSLLIRVNSDKSENTIISALRACGIYAVGLGKFDRIGIKEKAHIVAGFGALNESKLRKFLNLLDLACSSI